MAIKNYTSDKPLEKIFAELQQTLAAHGAKQISYEYGGMSAHLLHGFGRVMALGHFW
jgi:hypothetical protein